MSGPIRKGIAPAPATCAEVPGLEEVVQEVSELPGPLEDARDVEAVLPEPEVCRRRKLL